MKIATFISEKKNLGKCMFDVKSNMRESLDLRV